MSDNERLARIEVKLDKFIEANGKQNERIAVLEADVRNNEKQIEDNKKDADRRFGVVWKIGGGAVVIAFGLLFALIQGGIIG